MAARREVGPACAPGALSDWARVRRLVAADDVLVTAASCARASVTASGAVTGLFVVRLFLRFPPPPPPRAGRRPLARPFFALAVALRDLGTSRGSGVGRRLAAMFLRRCRALARARVRVPPLAAFRALPRLAPTACAVRRPADRSRLRALADSDRMSTPSKSRASSTASTRSADDCTALAFGRLPFPFLPPRFGPRPLVLPPARRARSSLVMRLSGARRTAADSPRGGTTPPVTQPPSCRRRPGERRTAVVFFF